MSQVIRQGRIESSCAGEGIGFLFARPAGAADVDQIAELVGQWAGGGLTISRSREEIASCVDDFVVVEEAGEILACGAAHSTCSGRVVEIRSVAVREQAAGAGAGRLVVSTLVERSGLRGASQAVLLTKIPAFFARCGFRVVKLGTLPGCYREGVLKAGGRDLRGRTPMRCRIQALGV